LANDGITIYVALGENKKAIRFLQKAADEHVGWVVRLGIDPALDSLRAEPDFNKLKERIGEIPGAASSRPPIVST
jgi:hypothetical protein